MPDILCHGIVWWVTPWPSRAKSRYRRRLTLAENTRKSRRELLVQMRAWKCRVVDKDEAKREEHNMLRESPRGIQVKLKRQIWKTNEFAITRRALVFSEERFGCGVEIGRLGPKQMSLSELFWKIWNHYLYTSINLYIKRCFLFYFQTTRTDRKSLNSVAQIPTRR